ncbi:MAG: hypothetical protein IH585_07980, partial [Anaerolineaceae bacterium]|nr:hypothetical protein [Anaerolineaceae bacterium]
MELKKYIEILWHRKWIIITTIIFTMAVVVTLTRLQTPIYQASAILRIATTAGGQASYQDYMYADRLMNTFIKIATSEPLIKDLMDQLNMDSRPNVVAEIISNTELIKISVEDRNPEMAAIIANSLAKILTANNNELYSGADISTTEILEEQLVIAKEEFENSQKNYLQLLVQTPAAPDEIALAQENYNLYEYAYSNLLARYQDSIFREAVREKMITIAEPASAPLSPSKPQSQLNYALGLFVGIIGGIGLAFLFDNLDTTIHTTDEIETITNLSPIVEIPKGAKKRLDISKNHRSQYAEAFRKFAMKIQLKDNHLSKKVLLVLSAEPQQGKSLIVYNLAIALAETGKT